jgi:hypothetical protein
VRWFVFFLCSCICACFPVVMFVRVVSASPCGGRFHNAPSCRARVISGKRKCNGDFPPSLVRSVVRARVAILFSLSPSYLAVYVCVLSALFPLIFCCLAPHDVCTLYNPTFYSPQMCMSHPAGPAHQLPRQVRAWKQQQLLQYGETQRLCGSRQTRDVSEQDHSQASANFVARRGIRRTAE